MFPLIQWLTDLAMFVVVTFTNHHNKESAGVSRVTRYFEKDVHASIPKCNMGYDQHTS